MIRVWLKPASSSVRRIAPTRPSIMSEGAITSQPASAWTRACLARTARVASFDHVVALEQTVVAVGGVGIERDVADHAELRQRVLDRAHRPADQVVRVGRLAAVGGLELGRGDRKQSDRGHAEPRRLARVPAATGRSRSGRCPASRPPARSGSWPSSTNTGQIRSADIQPVLGDQSARPAIAPVATQTGRRKARQNRRILRTDHEPAFGLPVRIVITIVPR